jgi:hypothetical protein
MAKGNFSVVISKKKEKEKLVEKEVKSVTERVFFSDVFVCSLFISRVLNFDPSSSSSPLSPLSLRV